jgi:hypothetical protein
VDVLDLVSEFKALEISNAVSIFVEFINSSEDASKVRVVLFEN